MFGIGLNNDHRKEADAKKVGDYCCDVDMVLWWWWWMGGAKKAKKVPAVSATQNNIRVFVGEVNQDDKIITRCTSILILDPILHGQVVHLLCRPSHHLPTTLLYFYSAIIYAVFAGLSLNR